MINNAKDSIYADAAAHIRQLMAEAERVEKVKAALVELGTTALLISTYRRAYGIMESVNAVTVALGDEPPFILSWDDKRISQEERIAAGMVKSPTLWQRLTKRGKG